MYRPNLSFRPSVRPAVPSQNFPAGALVVGQRPDRALNSAQFAAREGFARNPVFALIVRPPDWKVGPRVPFAEPPNGTPEPRREEDVKIERDIKGLVNC